jgi:hypothetical protein
MVLPQQAFNNDLREREKLIKYPTIDIKLCSKFFEFDQDSLLLNNFNN